MVRSAGVERLGLSMANRETKRFVDINRPFQVPGLSRLYPAGRYEVTTEEEPLGDSMTPVFKRISTVIYLPREEGDENAGDIIPQRSGRIFWLPE